MTIDAEAARRAKLAGIPAEAVRPYVEAEVQEHPFRLTYGDLAHSLQLAEITFIEGAVWTTLNVRHPLIADWLLGSREEWNETFDEEVEVDHVTRRQRSQIEVMLMVVLGARPDLTPEEERFYQSLHHDLSNRLGTAIPILLKLLDA